MFMCLINGGGGYAGRMGASSSPMQLNLEARLRIARGVARGLAFIHEKKGVHGNVKPGAVRGGDALVQHLGRRYDQSCIRRHVGKRLVERGGVRAERAIDERLEQADS